LPFNEAIVSGLNISSYFTSSSLAIIFLVFVLKPNNGEINKQLKELKEENNILKKKNDSIFVNIKQLDKLKEEADQKIALLENEEARQAEQLKSVNSKLTQLKRKYEKASNHSANFSSDDVKRYFSDSLNF
jgi:chromosome segregation ATPase